MNSQTLSSRADLEHAEAVLREVLVADREQPDKRDAGSLGRMLVHIVNIHQAVGSSPERHSNAAKRLGDFAMTTTRMIERNPESAPKLNRLTLALRTASERLALLAGASASRVPADNP